MPFAAWARGTGEDWFRIGEGCPVPRGCRALLLMGRAGDGAVWRDPSCFLIGVVGFELNPMFCFCWCIWFTMPTFLAGDADTIFPWLKGLNQSIAGSPPATLGTLLVSSLPRGYASAAPASGQDWCPHGERWPTTLALEISQSNFRHGPF